MRTTAAIIEHFTPRERLVCRLIGEKWSIKEIAKRLLLGMSTIETHRANASRKAEIKGDKLDAWCVRHREALVSHSDPIEIEKADIPIRQPVNSKGPSPSAPAPEAFPQLTFVVSSPVESASVPQPADSLLVNEEDTAPPVTLLDFMRGPYTLERGIEQNTAYQLDRAIRDLGEFIGHDPAPSELSDDLLSRWVQAREAEHFEGGKKAGKRKYAPKTLHGRRGGIIGVWRYAFDRGLCGSEPSRRIRRVKLERANPTAWTQEEVSALLAATKKFKGYLANGLPRTKYFHTLFSLCYETGLRKSDCLNLTVSQIDADGVVVMMQHKTRQGHVCKLYPETAEAFMALHAILVAHDEEYPDRPLRWPHAPKTLYQQIDQIVEAAGVRHGALQQMRRTGATAIEREQPGAATAFLGHLTPDLAIRNYIDRSIANVPRTPPRPMAPPMQATIGGEA